LKNTSETRFLIINADDLGYTCGVNRTIARCHRQGVLTSTTLMANGDAFQDALARVKDLPTLGVGVHLVLTELRPLAPTRAIPGLVSGSGRLPPTPGVLFRAVLEGGISRRVLETELEWQVLKILDEGVVPTHLDTHKHVHVLPAVLDCVIRVAQKYDIPWLRNPFDETSVVNSLPSFAGKDRPALCRQYLKTRVFSVFRSRFNRCLRTAGLRSSDHFFGTVITGLWSEASLRQIVNGLPAGINELMTHPGECDAELRRQSTRLRKSRERERDILLAPSFRNLLHSQQIILTHYGEHAR
jgi:predicted glycoside hydrolase/deacetylase ChbG (UPF0249 family)